MRIELTDHEAEVLREYLDRIIGDLGMEIPATDAPLFREQLRERRESLRRVRAALGAEVPTA
jgi:hypothetical protein